MATESSVSLTRKRVAIRTPTGTRSWAWSDPVLPPLARKARPPAQAARPKMVELRNTTGRGPCRMPSTTITATEATKAAASGPNSTAVAMWAATENEALLSPRPITNASAAIASPSRGATSVIGCPMLSEPVEQASATIAQNRTLSARLYRRTAELTGGNRRGCDGQPRSDVSACGTLFQRGASERPLRVKERPGPARINRAGPQS